MPRKQTNKAEVAPVKAPKKTVAAKAIKKAPAKAKVAKAKKEVVLKGVTSCRKTAADLAGHKYLDLGLMVDCTSSMCSWIDRAKKTLIEIINNVKASCDGKLVVRVTFVGYRDHCDSDRFAIKGFTEDLEDVKAFIQSTSASGGGDTPEDVVGGMRQCLK